MKNLFITFLLIVLASCSQNTEEVIDPVLTQELSYSLDNGESFSTSAPEMHYDSLQQVTFLKFTDPSIKVRINFRGRSTGTYIEQEGIFYKYSYDTDGNQSIDVVCDTHTGIEVQVDEYGAVRGLISGSFIATNCDGLSSGIQAQGSFSVIRTE